MTDVLTLPDLPTVTPRHSAALIVAATLSFVGAALAVGALFPDYFDAPPLALVDQTGPLAQTIVFALGLLVAGTLLLGTRSAPIGAAMLAVIVVVALQPRVVDGVRLAESGSPKAGTGFALLTAGFLLALVAAVLAAVVTLRPGSWSIAGRAKVLATLAALTGFGTAVGFAMNPFEVDAGPFSIGFASPFEPLPRQLWAAVLVVVVLTVVPPIAVAVGARIGTGLALGLLFAIGGIAALRVGVIYGSIDGRDTGYSGAEGTWTFLAAGGAAVIMTFAGLAAGGARGPRAPRGSGGSLPVPVQATVPPPAPAADEPTQPVVVGDTPEAIDFRPDEGDDRSTAAPDVTGTADVTDGSGSSSGAAESPARVDPMPPATPT
jgi:hypothetical protein